MSLFFISFFLLYGGMHSYVFLKALHAFNFKWSAGTCIGFVFLIMIFAPVLVRFLEKGGHDSSARLAAYGGYTWLGLIFLFFTISLSLDVFRLFTFVTGSVLKTNVSFITSAYRLFFILSFVGALLIGFYGHMEADNIRIETIRIYTNKIPKDVGRIIIAQISDVHIGLIVREEKLKKIAELVKRVNPDILVSTGDLVDGDINGQDGLANILGEIETKYGKFAITGNHEFHAGIENSLGFTGKAGFVMLRGESITIHGLINLAGVDDIAGKPYHYRDIPERTLLSKLPQGLFTILLKHRPVIDKDALGFFDLQLSGHTHKGQIYPFRYLTRLFFPLYTGYHVLSAKAQLYVSKGSGTWGPPIRFLAPPEVTAFELIYVP